MTVAPSPAALSPAALAPGGPRAGRARAAGPAIRPGPVLAGAFLALVCVAAIWPGLLASQAPNAINPADALQNPGAAHLLGTDQLGRDSFARLVYGARYSLLLGLASTALAGLVGAGWGLIAALGGKVADEVSMRLADIFMSFPSILLALLVVAVLGPGPRNVTVAIAVALAPGFARVVRVQGLVVKNSEYVTAATALGLRRRTVIARHIAPNVLSPLAVLVTMNVGASIIAGASLSFLGLGVQPPASEWGAMLAQSRDYLQNDWLLAVFPGLAITLTVISVGVLGRQLQARFEGRAAS
jgi:peptide/nickel transport system permease protein